MTFISSLKLHNFRCYDSAALEGLSSGLIVLYGANGAGKTNVLEAVSLLSPGRGLRAAKNLEILKQDSESSWAVSAGLVSAYGAVQIGTGLDESGEKRIIRINGENVRGQSALAEHVVCVWLTPQMDRLFLDSASHRRRFLDRLIFAFDTGHSGRITRYENAMRQRARLLQDGLKNGGADSSWLDGLEAQMAEAACAIAAARLEFVSQLQAVCNAADDGLFPRAVLDVEGVVEGLIAGGSALDAEDIFKAQLLESRVRDAHTGGARSGVHKTDLRVVYAAKNMMADQCSTGEQKALLIGIICAHARLIADARGVPPILLLDEVAAHLDEARRAALYDLLIDLGGQVWLTGTDENLFDAVAERAVFFEVCDGKIRG